MNKTTFKENVEPEIRGLNFEMDSEGGFLSK